MRVLHDLDGITLPSFQGAAQNGAPRRHPPASRAAKARIEDRGEVRCESHIANGKRLPVAGKLLREELDLIPDGEVIGDTDSGSGAFRNLL
jgi:hypothetical protein